MIRTHVTDGGKLEAGFTNETNDCSVRALSLAADLPYATAHGLLKSEGRRDRRGAKVTMLERALKAADIQHEQIAVGLYGARPTLADTLRRHKVGRYIVITAHHALAVIDGVVHDQGEISGPRSRVRFLYRITDATVAPVIAPAVAAPITQPQINELWERLQRLG